MSTRNAFCSTLLKRRTLKGVNASFHVTSTPLVWNHYQYNAVSVGHVYCGLMTITCCATFISGRNKISMYSGVLYEYVLFST